MSKIHLVRDSKKRASFAFSELFNVALKYVKLQEKFLCKKRVFFFLQRRLNRASKVFIVNRCIATQRGRGVSRSHGLSRILFRDMLKSGLIPGYKKGVW